MKKIFASLLLFCSLGAMKKVPEWTEKDFELARRIIGVLNSVDNLKDEITRQIIDSEEKMKQFLIEELKKIEEKENQRVEQLRKDLKELDEK